MRCPYCGGDFDEMGICPCGMDERLGVDYRGLGRSLPMRYDPAQIQMELDGMQQTSLALPENREDLPVIN